jgi:hypothetical protein
LLSECPFTISPDLGEKETKAADKAPHSKLSTDPIWSAALYPPLLFIFYTLQEIKAIKSESTPKGNSGGKSAHPIDRAIVPLAGIATFRC